METVTDFTLLGSKITADGDCSHEIKRHLLLGRKAMTNLDSILKSRDITWPAKVHLNQSDDISHRKFFLDQLLQWGKAKENSKGTSLTSKAFAQHGKHSAKEKENPHDKEKIFATKFKNKDSISKTCKQFMQLNIKSQSTQQKTG